MLNLDNQTYQNILQTMLNYVSNAYDKREGSVIQTALGPAAYALEEFYLALNQIQQQAFIQTAVGQNLDYLSVLGGISRYPASAAVRLGVFNTAVPLGARFSTINGADSINFIVTAATDTPNEYQLTAETAGAIGNAYTGSILPITYIQGLTSAQITDILVPGDDEETDDELRARLITALNEKPFGGNIAQYREQILEIDGVGAVQVYPTWNGGGTVECSVIGANYNIASQTLIDNVQNAIDPPPNQGLGLGLAPIGAQVTIVTPTALSIDIEADITLASGYILDQVQTAIEEAIGEYFLSVRESWGTPLNNNVYAADIYISRIIAAIINVTGVVNATNVTLNGTAADIITTQTGATQELPIVGTVTLNVAS